MREFQGDSAEFKGRMSLNRGAEQVLKGHEELEENPINLVKGMRGGGQPLNASVLHAVLEGVVEVKAPQLLQSNGGPWGLSENWVKEWIRSKLGWSFKVATTAAQKLPKDWEHQLDMMAYRAAFEVLTHGVPAELMVNMDQTAMHLVPSGGEPDVRQAGQEGDRSDGSRRQASNYHLCELSCRRNNASSSANLPGKELSQPSKWPHSEGVASWRRLAVQVHTKSLEHAWHHKRVGGRKPISLLQEGKAHSNQSACIRHQSSTWQFKSTRCIRLGSDKLHQI